MPSTCWSTRARTSRKPAQYRAQGAACRAAQGRQPADPLWRPCHRQGRDAVRGHLQGGRRGHHLEEGQGALSTASGSKNWLKIKCIQRQEFVIVGWQDSDKRHGFRSLHLAARDGRKLKYAGKVGTGFDTQDDPRPQRSHAAAGGRRAGGGRAARRRGAARTGSSRSWSPRSPSPNSPAMVCFATRASSRLREDKPAREVVLEKPQKLSSVAKSKKADAGTVRQFRDQDQQPRPRHLPRRRPDQGRPRRLLCRDRSADAGRHGQAADQPGPLPAGPGQAMLLPEARQRRDGPACEACADQGKRRRRPGLSLCRGCARDPRLRADGDDRVPRLGQPRRQAGTSRPAGVRSRSRRRPRLRQGEGGGGAGSARCSPTSASSPSRC